MAQVVEHLLSKHKALSSNPNTAKQTKQNPNSTHTSSWEIPNLNHGCDLTVSSISNYGLSSAFLFQTAKHMQDMYLSIQACTLSSQIHFSQVSANDANILSIIGSKSRPCMIASLPSLLFELVILIPACDYGLDIPSASLP
jgi:hypothetical protein